MGKRKPIDVEKARRERYDSIVKRDREGKKITAVERAFVQEFEAGLAAKKKTAVKDELNGGASLEEDLEEWTLRDGVVRGSARRLSSLAAMHQVDRVSIDKVLWKIQRGLLARYGFEGTKKTGALTGNEALALQWVKSIAQLARASQEWELQMEEAEQARLDGQAFTLDRFTGLVLTMKQIADKRDNLSLKVRELSAKERKAGTGRGQKAHVFEIRMADGKKKES